MSSIPPQPNSDPVEQWMETHGFEFCPNGTSEGGMWKLPAIAKKRVGFFVSPSTAAFFHQITKSAPQFNDEAFRDQCIQIQILTRLDDKAWQERFGNGEGLYGFLAQHTKSAVLAGELSAIDLLYWKYKEMNDQSVDKTFAEAYGIIKDELQAQQSKVKEGAQSD